MKITSPKKHEIDILWCLENFFNANNELSYVHIVGFGFMHIDALLLTETVLAYLTRTVIWEQDLRYRYVRILRR